MPGDISFRNKEKNYGHIFCADVQEGLNHGVHKSE